MSNIYDGDHNNTIKFRDKSMVYETQGGVVLHDVHSSEALFRGFEKEPKVLCERLDITPFLKKKTETELHCNHDANEINSDEILSNESMKKLMLKCSVDVVRDDLEKLKEMVMKKTIINGELSLKRKICDEAYSSETKLQNHQESKHTAMYSPNGAVRTPKRVSFSDQIIVHEVKEYHRCKKCPKIFENYTTLKLHMKQNHKKCRCYICFYCSKNFVDRKIFKAHIKMHCDACGLLLPTKQKYLEHRRSVCKITKRYECKTCHITLFNFMDLKDHSYEHLGTHFICDICKDQFQTKCSVSHHIRFLHTKKRPKELYAKQMYENASFYECNFCDMQSVKQNFVDDHVSVLPNLENKGLTGYKNFYFCDQCFEKFSTETDMLQHKWSHFLKTSDNSQLRVESNKNILKTTYKIDEKLPDLLQPKLVLKKVEVPKENAKEPTQLSDMSNIDYNCIWKKPVVDPVTKKTIISKHRCEKCGKYLSSNYSLHRHMQSVHGICKDSSLALRCGLCEEEFVWPSLLKTHKCIRTMLPEMPFDDARPEVHFDNMHQINSNNYNVMGIADDDDYMNSAEFEMPAPIVQLTEFENLNIVINGGNGQLNVINNDKSYPLNGLSYKVVMQEVPIEF